jgi:hypothetical protein
MSEWFALADDGDGCGRAVGAEQRFLQLGDLAFRNLGLRDHDQLVRSENSGEASALQLVGPQAGQHHELECPEAWRSEDHNEPADRLNPEAGTLAIAGWERSCVTGPSQLRLW